MGAVTVGLLDLIDTVKNITRIVHKFLAIGSQYHSFGASLEYGNSKIGFKLFDRSADIRLRDHQRFRCFIQRSESRNLDRVLHM